MIFNSLQGHFLFGALVQAAPGFYNFIFKNRPTLPSPRAPPLFHPAKDLFTPCVPLFIPKGTIHITCITTI